LTFALYSPMLLSYRRRYAIMSFPISAASTEQSAAPNPWVLSNRALTVFYGCPEMPAAVGFSNSNLVHTRPLGGTTGDRPLAQKEIALRGRLAHASRAESTTLTQRSGKHTRLIYPLQTQSARLAIDHRWHGQIPTSFMRSLERSGERTRANPSCMRSIG
jgi:hypothetical protein